MSFTKSQTIEYSRRSSISGLAVFLLDVLILVACAIGAVTCSDLGIQMLFSAGMGIAISVLFVVGHDAGHQSLTPYRWLNEVVGRFALLPSLHPFSLWILVHNQTHHRWTNLSPHDYVWTPLSMSQFKELNLWNRSLYRFYRSFAGPVLYYLIEFWIKRFVFPSRSEVRGRYKAIYVFDSCFVFSFAIAYIAFLCIGAEKGWFGGVRPIVNSLFFGAVAPFLIWNVVMSFVIYLHHTHPRLVWYDNEAEWKEQASQAQAAVHVVFPGPVNLVFHWIMEHNAHHARPSIPLYHLRDAQRTLEASNDDLVVFNWTVRGHLDVVRRCKLYDYKRKCWLSFAGEPTSAMLHGRQVVQPPKFASSKARSGSLVGGDK